MKKNSLSYRFLLVLVGTLAPVWLCQAQTVFFNDTFNNGSTIAAASVPPTAHSTSYEIVSSQQTFGSVSPNDLNFGITNAGGGNICEIEALFATSQIALAQAGDNIQLTIVYTNTQGLWCGGAPLTALSTGLYSSGQVLPFGTNTMNAQLGTLATTGGAQSWAGYTVEVANSGSSPHYDIYSRPAQPASAVNNQDLTSQGSSTKSFASAVIINGKGASAVFPPATTNICYTNVLSITLISSSPVIIAITNSLYNSTGLVTITNGLTTNGVSSSYTQDGFDSFAMGFYKKGDLAGSTVSNILDIASITVSGSVSAITNAPSITTEPSNALVATNGTCAFQVAASGFDMTYQWYRSGTNILDGGNISGSTSPLLVLSPAGVSDELSSYYCTVTGAGGYTTNTTTASLNLIASTNLVWDENNNANWSIGIPTDNNWTPASLNNPSVYTTFTFGDPVIFNDAGFGGAINLTNNFLSASSVTVSNLVYNYFFAGSGSFAGPGSLSYVGGNGSYFYVDNANTYSGGTLISNATAYLVLSNLTGLGTGPIVLGKAGGQMEISPAGTTGAGIPNNIVVADDFQFLFDASSNSFSGVLTGDISGTPNKTLSLNNSTGYTGGIDRIRAYGNDTVDNANLNLASAAILLASYSAGTQTYNGVISGPGAFMEKGTITYFNGANTYSGGTYPAQGVMGLGCSSIASPASGPLGTGPILLAPDSTTTVLGNGMIIATVPNVTINNAIQYTSGTNNLTLQIGGANNLTLSGAFTLNGNDAVLTNAITNRIVQVTNTALTTISGVISDGGAGYGFDLTGTGVLALNNTETYTGSTIVSNGTLLVNGRISSTAAVTVMTNGILGGSGTVTGPITVQTGGALNAGSQGIGTLTASSLTFQAGSTNIVDVSQSSGNSKVTGLTSVTYSGVLAPVVVSGTVTSGQNFTIFSAGSESGNFTSIAGSPAPGYGWSFTPATGVLTVTGSGVIIPTIPPNVTSIALSGANVTITATNGVNGGTYYLLGTTNITTPVAQWLPVSTNVVTASGSTEGFTFTGTNAYVVGAPSWYFMLSSTNN